MMVNSATSNWFGDFLQYISPLRFGNELGMRRLLTSRNYIEDIVLNFFGFTWGVGMCYMALVLYSAFFFLLGWAIMVFKARSI